MEPILLFPSPSLSDRGSLGALFECRRAFSAEGGSFESRRRFLLPISNDSTNTRATAGGTHDTRTLRNVLYDDFSYPPRLWSFCRDW